MSYTTAAMPSRARGLFRSAAFAVAALLAPPALAGETGAPPQLPPPPPPPVSPSQPPAPPPKAAPATTSAQSTGAPTRVMPASSSSSSSSSSVSSTDGGRVEGEIDTRWALAGMIGFATDYLDFGMGLRGGKTLDNHLYLGGSMLYHFVGGGGYYGGSASVFYIGPEAGYDFDLKPVVLRVYGGLGPAFFNYSACAGNVCASGSDTRFVVWPGVSVLWSIPDSAWFIGGDVRFVSVPGGPSVGFFFTGGMHF